MIDSSKKLTEWKVNRAVQTSPSKEQKAHLKDEDKSNELRNQITSLKKDCEVYQSDLKSRNDIIIKHEASLLTQADLIKYLEADVSRLKT